MSKKLALQLKDINDSLTYLEQNGFITKKETGYSKIGLENKNPLWKFVVGLNPNTYGVYSNDDAKLYGRAGKDIPPGWVIDESGNTRTDTEQILKDLTLGKAALTPLGGLGAETAGYKGYGYATVVEILSAALQDGAFMKALNGKDENGKAIPYPLGHFFIAIDPDFFMGRETFKRIASAILKELRESKKAPGQERIYTAGELEYESYQIRKEYGCPVPPSLQKVIKELSARYSLTDSWPF